MLFGCNRTVELRHAALNRGRPPHTPIMDFESKLRCNLRGKREVLTVSLIKRSSFSPRA